MTAIDPYALDRAIGSAEAALRRARETLRSEPEASAERPLAGHDRVSRRDELIELVDLAERRPDEPMWRAAVPHVRELVVSRATFVDERREALVRTAERHVVESPIRSEETIAAMLDAVLEARTGELASAWARTLADRAHATQIAALFLHRRRAEAARLVGDVDLDAHDAPVVEPPLLFHAARGVLDVTSDVVPGASCWEDAVRAALGRDGHEGYPAKLTARWLAASLPAGLLDGLALDVDPLPRLLGATSFARALGALGAAIAQADSPRGLPRCIARAPRDLLVARRRALLADLVAQGPFLRRRLGLGRSAAREQAAATLRLLVASLRADAARVLAREIDPRTRGAEERVAELASSALGAPVAPALAYVVPRVRPGDAARLIGAVVAATDVERIVDELDEDWFEGPRTAETLRHEHHAHRADVRATKDDIDAGLAALRRRVSTL